MGDLKTILESTVLNDESKVAITEAWEAKLTEAREEIAAELREEFANRYSHDINLVKEAADKMIRDTLTEEISEFVSDKKKLKEDRVNLAKSKAKITRDSAKFIKETLAEELKQYHQDRKLIKENLHKMATFVKEVITEEVSEFAEDKKNLIQERVSLERRKKTELRETKQRFLESATKLSEKFIRNTLKTELAQLKGDIMESKKKYFGTKLFEAFAEEFMDSHYNESSQVATMAKYLEDAKEQITSLKESISAKDKVILEARQEVKVANDLRERNDIMVNLLKPLNKSQQRIMRGLLENSNTTNLRRDYDKYLSSVLNEDDNKTNSEKSFLTEKINNGTAYTGNRKNSDDDVIVNLKKLSGIN